MYDNLRCNIPKQLMAFHDHPFADALPCFVSHRDVQGYLEQYAAQHSLNQCLTLNRKITSISEHSDAKWLVSSVNVASGSERDEQHEIYDRVAVCSGAGSMP